MYVIKAYSKYPASEVFYFSGFPRNFNRTDKKGAKKFETLEEAQRIREKIENNNIVCAIHKLVNFVNGEIVEIEVERLFNQYYRAIGSNVCWENASHERKERWSKL